MSVELPEPYEWVDQTRIQLQYREQVIQTLGRLLVDAQAVHCFWEIDGSNLVIREIPKQKTINSRQIVRIIGFGLIVTGIIMLVFNFTLTGTYPFYRTGWSTRSLSGFGVIFLGFVFILHDVFGKKP